MVSDTRNLKEATGKAEPVQRRPVTLFTGQWADLPFEEMCRLASEWGYDGLEIACWGDHFDVAKAAEDDGYLQGRKDILEKHGLGCWAISNHLNGQAVCEAIIDERYKNMVNPRVWGDGDPEGVRQRAAEEMKITARAAAAFGVDTVVGSFRRAMPISLIAGTRSSTSSMRSESASLTRFIPARSLTTTGPLLPHWRLLIIGLVSASTSIPRTWSGRTWTMSGSCGISGIASTTWTARTPRSG
jgi:hypothetical protein